MSTFKHQPFWHFNRGERLGILSLLFIILLLLGFIYFIPISNKDTFDASSSEIMQRQRELDSLRCLAIEQQKPRRYPFNPNYLSDYKAYTLGITPEQYDRLKSFREQGKWVNSTADFQKVTLVPDSILNEISPYFKFPDWVQRSRSNKKRTFAERKPFSGTKTDLNSATQEQLQEVYGIGEVFSKRIIAKRKELNGFAHGMQLYDVWGLRPEVIERILERFEVKNPVPIEKMNINRASASDLSTIPGVSFGLAKKIWEFVYVREGISDFEELAKIEELTPQKLQLIQLYLLIE
ncbi:helix-hairpin-helix domain-containing protein [Aureisphaera galaxeae]|uniref:ComEA family DNA-binding protein n=1 Tax=Aureisphaera galaxeae TaxID=1538023 RepID=UPI002350DBFC|nr:helix-hairpin-helix domain-containing protein [Aureisphaera galaxeae]MDC8004485.1 helix-hairpin-helix domain-containing protein [Aureisphaera galaxeae]